MSQDRILEWGDRVKSEGNIIYIYRNDDNESKVNTDEVKMSEILIPVNPENRKRTNIYDPRIISRTSGLYLHNRTLTEGEINMTENNDWLYTELKEDLRESERRISRDVREREERFEKMIERSINDSKEREERFMKNVEEIKQIVSDGEKNRGRYTAAMWTLAITTIIGIAAMVITVVVSV